MKLLEKNKTFERSTPHFRVTFYDEGRIYPCS